MVMNRRPDDMVRITTPELADAFIEEQIKALREQIGDKKVLLALSGGVDSSVVAAMLIKAIGDQLASSTAPLFLFTSIHVIFLFNPQFLPEF